MATASGGRASIVTAGTSSFRQFRLTQFQPPNAELAQPTTSTSSIIDDTADKAEMAQTSRPSSGQNINGTPSNAPARPALPDQSSGNPSASGFRTLELVELTSNPLLEGVLGPPNKDGRVRNPVPSKLKGKTDTKQGNFGVMLMGASPAGKSKEAVGKEAIAAERDAAARRTSENTASRAKAAQLEKYAPARKMMNDISKNLMNDVANRGTPLADQRQQRARPLSPDETKAEQARLLTLLRSINPFTVVDQLCKAVAYFGGIPGAPPPEDGIFPESANTRETGALFIGWLAEIFPNLSSPEVPRIQEVPRKRGGRPSRGGAGATPVESPNPRNGFGYGQAVSAPAWGLPQSLAEVTAPDVASRLANPPLVNNKQPEAPTPLSPIKPHLDDGAVPSSTRKRGRGRPKGSRNKGGKNDPPQPTTATGGSVSNETNQQNGQNQIINVEHPHKSPHLQKEPEKAPQLPEAQIAYTPMAQQNASKANLNQGYPENPWYTNHQKPIAEAPPNVIPISDELSPEERAVIEAFGNTGVPDASDIRPSPIVPPIKAQVGQAHQATGVKRKRAPPKSKPVPAPSPNLAKEHIQQQPSQGMQSGQSMQAAQNMQNMQPVQNNTHSMPISNENLSNIANGTMQWAPVSTTSNSGASASAPAPKRQRVRKPKAPATNGSPGTFGSPSVNQSPLIVSATPPIAPSTIPDSTASSTQQSMQQSVSSQSVPVSRPPAEGLEAHYERFASAPQQIGRSHTPSITPQQHLRQQQKSPAVPAQPQQQPQQPSVQHQVQMQQQKSQQGSQREEQKTTQAPSARSSSSSGFYSQRNSHGNAYSQQYPSHQPSQLYGVHQASPQMSSVNSYRTSSTHTLSQASPQFSQTTENTYRTASPHTVAQPSPSFTQPDNSFRAASTHNLAQPSPTYSQAENTYRTTSAQATTSYSRPQTLTQSSHQSQYNHFGDSSYVDLPTLESLGHSGTANTGSLGGYGQPILGNASSSRSASNSNSIYGTSSGMNSAFDIGTNDLLRGVNRSSGGSNAYGGSSGLGGAFDSSGTSEHERALMRNLGRR